MPDVGERLEKVEQGLTELSQRVDERFDEVRQRLDKIDGRFGEVDQRFNQLQMLGEENTSNIKLVAEVQAHHGTVLEQIKEVIEPLKGIRPLFEQVARDHEQRITALERARLDRRRSSEEMS